MMLNVQEEEEGNVLVNDTLNTFLIQLYGIRHMVNDHCRALHGLLFPVSSKGSFVCSPYRNRIAHATSFVTPVV